MQVLLNTKLLFSKELITALIKLPADTSVIQLDCHDMSSMLPTNPQTKEDELLIQEIKSCMLTNPIPVWFNKICYLYFHGGMIINNNIRITNFSTTSRLYQSHSACFIRSCANSKTIFDGWMIAPMYSTELKEIIQTFLLNPTNTTTECILNNHRHQILEEEIKDNRSNLFDTDQTTIFAEHYFKHSSLLETFKLTKSVPTANQPKKIGITINLPSTLKDFYCNGIKQNCMYLYELLHRISPEWEVKLILDNGKNISVLKEIDFYTFEYVLLEEVFLHDFDLIFSMGFSIPSNIFVGLKNTGVKVVYYMCGNNYLIDSEKILYNQHSTRTVGGYNRPPYDQIWIIPQMVKQNQHYCEILQKSKCIQVPFIWSPMSISFVTKILKLDDDTSLLYKKKKSNIGIFEPNISVMKWALPSLLIAEKTHRTYRNISHVYITNINNNKKDQSTTTTANTANTANDFNFEQFNNICRELDLFHDKKLSVEGRYVTLEFMSKHCDIAISHQWENPLNYLYLDLAWMGWPILHNAELCQDIGYYYEGFNYADGSEKLNDILTNHDANAEHYRMKNRQLIDMYLPTNLSLQEKYKNLIGALFSPN